MDDHISGRIITPMSQQLLQAIDDYRFANRLPSRADAIRRLIQAGLKAEAAPNPRKSPAKG